MQQYLSKLVRRDYVAAAIALLVLLIGAEVGWWLPVVTAVGLTAYYYRDFHKVRIPTYAVVRDEREEFLRHTFWSIGEILKHLHMAGVSGEHMNVFSATARHIAFMLPRVCSQKEFTDPNTWKQVRWTADSLWDLACAYLDGQVVKSSVIEELQRVQVVANGFYVKFATEHDPVVDKTELRRLMAPLALFRFFKEPAKPSDQTPLPGLTECEQGDFIKVNNRWMVVSKRENYFSAQDHFYIPFLTRYEVRCVDDGKCYALVGRDTWYLVEEVPAEYLGQKPLAFHRTLETSKVVSFSGGRYLVRNRVANSGLGVEGYDAYTNTGSLALAECPDEDRVLVSWKPAQAKDVKVIAGPKVIGYEFLAYAGGFMRG